MNQIARQNATGQIFQGVLSAGSKKGNDIKRLFARAPKVFQEAFAFFLVNTKQFPGIELTARNQGISGYGLSGKVRRECFHFGINREDLIVYQFGEVPDPRKAFNLSQPGKESRKYGYISGADRAENEYVLDIFRRSYETITGKSTPPSSLTAAKTR